MPKSKRQKRFYSILVSSSQVRCINIEAYSPDQACQILQRQIAGQPRRDTDVASVLAWDVWSDPSEVGEEWIVAPAVKVQRKTNEVMSWDGKAIKTHRGMSSIFTNATNKKNKQQ